MFHRFGGGHFLARLLRDHPGESVRAARLGEVATDRRWRVPATAQACRLRFRKIGRPAPSQSRCAGAARLVEGSDLRLEPVFLVICDFIIAASGCLRLGTGDDSQRRYGKKKTESHGYSPLDRRRS